MPEAKNEDATKVKPGTILRAMKSNQVAELPSLTDEQCDEEPQLKVHRNGNRILRITATCVCGRKIEIHCDYEEPDS